VTIGRTYLQYSLLLDETNYVRITIKVLFPCNKLLFVSAFVLFFNFKKSFKIIL